MNRRDDELLESLDFLLHEQQQPPSMEEVMNNNNDEWVMKLSEIEDILLKESSSEIDIYNNSLANELQQIIKENSYRTMQFSECGETLQESSTLGADSGSVALAQELHQIIEENSCRLRSSLSDRNSTTSTATKKRRKRIPSINFKSLTDTGVVSAGDKVCYVNKRQKVVLKEGSITREGIVCTCCQKIYGVSNFEVHAGVKNHRPATNILLADGRSLMDLQIQIHHQDS